MKIIPPLICDFYKLVHPSQYPKDLSGIWSYYIPRVSRIDQDYLIQAGVQGFTKCYLVDCFNEHFFKKPLEEVVADYRRIVDATLGGGTYQIERIEALHKLGYLPLRVNALPEGTIVPIKVPMIEITNTHKDFAWVVNTIESLMSCTLWHTMVSANVGYRYRQIVNHFYDISVDADSTAKPNRALGDFSMRGQESLESAVKSSAAFLFSFLNSATIPAINYLEYYYNCDCTSEPVGYGAISTEHSVMCSNYSVDGDEITMIKRLLTELYPNHSFSQVSDSYDYWNLVNVLLPECKKEILCHNGTIFIRGDSGDPVEIVTKTVFRLWETFGGTINKKGFRVLNPKIRVIYGDSITPQRAIRIYQILIDNGFSVENVKLGVGSFSFQCLEGTNPDNSIVYHPYTRDTFGIAVKSTAGQLRDGTFIEIFKNPKTDSGNFKKSHKGICAVVKNASGVLECIDGLRPDHDLKEENEFMTVFLNGELFNQESIHQIRNRLHNGSF